VAEKIDQREVETILRDKLRQSGKSPEEVETLVKQYFAGARGYRGGRPRWEYKSEMSILGLPLVHIVRGRDPVTGSVGKAFGVIAIGRIAVGVLPIGQLAIGVLPIGQLALGAIFALGQGAFAGYISVGQLAVASQFALGQLAAAASAIGQLGFGNYVLAQVGWGTHVWSTKVQDPEALEHFKTMFAGLLEFFQ
jgi:hypothetical protein